MAIQFLDNQPITWRTDWPTDSDCKTPYDRACTLYTTNDYLMAQWKQTPCGLGTNQICDPNFPNVNPELVTNGSFTTNSTGWTLVGCTRDATNKRIQFSGHGQSLEQSGVVSAGTVYTVTFTIGGNTSTPLKLFLGGTQYTSASFFSPGTYSVTMTAGGTNNKIRFETNTLPPGFNGWIDDISVKQVAWTGGCWSTAQPALWVNNGDGTVSKIAGTASDLISSVNSLPLGAYIRIGIRVTNQTAGSLDIVTDSSKGTITSNGTYYFYDGDYNNDNVTFSADADFDGTISDISVVVYSNYFNVILKDTKGATDYDLSNQLTYDQDWVTLNYQLGSVDPGCYELCFYDACGYQLNDLVTCDVEFNDPINTSWQYLPEYGSVSSATISSSKFRIVAGDQTGFTRYLAWVLRDINSCNFIYPSNVTNVVFNYTLKTLQVDKEFKVQLIIPGASNNPFIIPFAESNSLYTGTINLSFPNGFTGTNYDVRFNTYNVGAPVSMGDVIEIDYFSLEIMSYVPGQANEYCSNCIEVRDSDDCTLWVGGSNGSDAFGFHFANNFQIGARVRAMMINPKYKGDSNRYADANGKYTVTKANSGKVYTLFIDYTDEHTHDWLRLAVLSDTVRIGAFTNTNNFYTAVDGDYEPEWPDTLGNWPSAQARIDMQKQTDELYNNNAG